MIASQKIGKSFMGALNYNLRKLYHPDPALSAELLDTNFTSLDTRQIRKEVDWLRGLKPNLNRYVYHTSLNFSKNDQLDNQKLLAIAHDYLNSSGYNNNQYFIFRHHDADHPHLHLLVNRISFDGTVVSDSNNYKKSEALLRKLELQYNLTAVQQSSYIAIERSSYTATGQHSKITKKRPYRKIDTGPGSRIPAELHSPAATQPDSYITTERRSYVSQRAPTKSELEMVLRSGQPSHKMILQELMSGLLTGQCSTIPDLIKLGEQLDINFLFNQASTGRVTGITYFYDGFKVKGQALGNRFKWAEIIKRISYEQDRDRQAISQANGRTTAKYPEGSAAERTSIPAATGPGRSERAGTAYVHPVSNAAEQHRSFGVHPQDSGTATALFPADETGGDNDSRSAERSMEAAQDAHLVDSHGSDQRDHDTDPIRIEIADDEDDALKRRRRRGR